jgi:integration host factor subunit beta
MQRSVIIGGGRVVPLDAGVVEPSHRGSVQEGRYWPQIAAGRPGRPASLGVAGQVEGLEKMALHHWPRRPLRIRDQNRHLYERDVENIVNAILGEIIAALARGDRVEIRGFGTFTIRNRRARIARNRQTGRTVAIEKKGWPYFKTGKEMRARLNRSPAVSVS